MNGFSERRSESTLRGAVFGSRRPFYRDSRGAQRNDITSSSTIGFNQRDIGVRAAAGGAIASFIRHRNDFSRRAKHRVSAGIRCPDVETERNRQRSVDRDIDRLTTKAPANSA